MKIRQEKETLSDGSHVFNIHLVEDDGAIITLHAIDERRAGDIIDCLIVSTVDIEEVFYYEN